MPDSDSAKTRFPYAPAQEWNSAEELDGIDINEGEGCPHCGGRRDRLGVGPAGYYTCFTCLATWAGEMECASLVKQPVEGPVGLNSGEETRNE